ncbi:MAG: hypothetical protein FWD89_01340 [Firmicutes bacterium]|nr:hypothetical protein [Bacillota bacterium]MCL2770936.1 hypothetical protein [Bacillota bacterium]
MSAEQKAQPKTGLIEWAEKNEALVKTEKESLLGILDAIKDSETKMNNLNNEIVKSETERSTINEAIGKTKAVQTSVDEAIRKTEESLKTQNLMLSYRQPGEDPSLEERKIETEKKLEELRGMRKETEDMLVSYNERFLTVDKKIWDLSNEKSAAVQEYWDHCDEKAAAIKVINEKGSDAAFLRALDSGEDKLEEAESRKRFEAIYRKEKGIDPSESKKKYVVDPHYHPQVIKDIKAANGLLGVNSTNLVINYEHAASYGPKDKDIILKLSDRDNMSPIKINKHEIYHHYKNVQLDNKKDTSIKDAMGLYESHIRFGLNGLSESQRGLVMALVARHYPKLGREGRMEEIFCMLYENEKEYEDYIRYEYDENGRQVLDDMGNPKESEAGIKFLERKDALAESLREKVAATRGLMTKAGAVDTTFAKAPGEDEAISAKAQPAEERKMTADEQAKERLRQLEERKQAARARLEEEYLKEITVKEPEPEPKVDREAEMRRQQEMRQMEEAKRLEQLKKQVELAALTIDNNDDEN